jgi:hypothetical protein
MLLTLGCGPARAQGAGAGERSRVLAAVSRGFGKGVGLASEHKPCFLVGDFNGDGRPDLVALVRWGRDKGSLPPGVRLLDPWKPAVGDGEGGSRLALAVIHGSESGWEGPAPAASFLLTSRPYFSTPMWEAAQPRLLSLAKRSARRKGDPIPVRAARGDAVILPTEAGIDIQLYWDGRTYRTYWPAEEP